VPFVRFLALFCSIFAAVGTGGCDGCDPGGIPADGDAGIRDAGGASRDGGSRADGAQDVEDGGWTADAGADAGGTGQDGGAPGDGGAWLDAGSAEEDGGVSADGGAGGQDGGAPADAGASEPDAGGEPDAGTPASPCVSGASGDYAVRFRWNGTTSGQTAWLSYETNTLPDTSRWKAGAYSQSIGYSPVFRDPFLGEGGLEMSGTVFMDIELSTAGLPAVQNATIAIYGRSYNTTSSGSFSWQTFSDVGATASGFVSNSAPYEWYLADATSALPAGDDGTLLRIRPGPPSGALIVNRVEVCFHAP
jgi:hypothetical protein